MQKNTKEKGKNSFGGGNLLRIEIGVSGWSWVVGWDQRWRFHVDNPLKKADGDVLMIY